MSDKAQPPEINNNIEEIIARIKKTRTNAEEIHKARLMRILRLAAWYHLDAIEPALLENAFEEIAREYLNAA